MRTVKLTRGRFGRALGVIGTSAALVTTAGLTGSPADAQAPKRGGRAVVVSPQEPRTLLLHLDLLTLDDKGVYVPRLPVEVSTGDNSGVSADARVYTFKFRLGVIWQDGQRRVPVTPRPSFDALSASGVGGLRGRFS
jgi:hypothetical protein